MTYSAAPRIPSTLCELRIPLACWRPWEWEGSLLSFGPFRPAVMAVQVRLHTAGLHLRDCYALLG